MDGVMEQNPYEPPKIPGESSKPPVWVRTIIPLMVAVTMIPQGVFALFLSLQAFGLQRVSLLLAAIISIAVGVFAFVR
jgi:hypothetical protein